MAPTDDLRHQRDDAIARAEHAEREAARLHELNAYMTGTYTYDEYSRVGQKTDG